MNKKTLDKVIMKIFTSLIDETNNMEQAIKYIRIEFKDTDKGYYDSIYSKIIKYSYNINNANLGEKNGV